MTSFNLTFIFYFYIYQGVAQYLKPGSHISKTGYPYKQFVSV